MDPAPVPSLSWEPKIFDNSLPSRVPTEPWCLNWAATHVERTKRPWPGHTRVRAASRLAEHVGWTHQVEEVSTCFLQSVRPAAEAERGPADWGDDRRGCALD